MIEPHDDYVENVRERMTAAYEEARQGFRKAAERNKRYYDVRVRPNKFKEGDWVLYFNPGSSSESRTNGSESTPVHFL